MRLSILCLAIYCLSLHAKPNQEISYTVTHLFSLNKNQAEVLFENRPTPCLAVNSQGNIAFPVNDKTICVFRQNGACIDTISDMTISYPKEMLFDDNDVLQVMDLSQQKIIKYYPEDKKVFKLTKLEDWWKHSNKIISRFLRDNKLDGFVWEEYDKCNPKDNSISRFNYFLDILILNDKIFVNGKNLQIFSEDGTKTIVSDNIGQMFGIINSSLFAVKDITNYGYIVDVETRGRLEITIENVTINKSLPSGFDGNFPETNKLNYRQNWYWQRKTNNIFLVKHIPTGFYFFKIEIDVEQSTFN